MRILLVPNTGKSSTVEAVRELSAWLADQGHEAVLTAQDAEVCVLSHLGVPDTGIGEPELAVALGGDGTIIRAVHLLGDASTPILGVNYGRLGFLTGANPDSMTASVAAALAGEAREERRMTLQASIVVGGRDVGHHHALNEVFVGRRGVGRVVDLAVRVNDTDLVTFTCDGLIVASPTGSTAYALSAGGPIVSPKVDGLVLVPVAPHTLASRSIVLAPDDEVEVVCPAEPASEVCLSMDGESMPCRMPLERVKVWRGIRDVTLLKLDGRDFLDVVGDKFLRG